MSSLTRTNCRICFVSCDESAKNASEIADLYNEVTGYVIFPMDTPQKVCKECHDQLIVVQEFRGICESSEKFLEEQRQQSGPVLPMLEMFVEPEPEIKIENEESTVVILSDSEDQGGVPKSKRQKQTTLVLEPPEHSLTFEEYEQVERMNKEHRRGMKKVEKIAKAKQAMKVYNVKLVNMVKISGRQPPPQQRKSKSTFFVNWDYQALRKYMEQRKIKISDAHSFVLAFDQNHLSPELLRANEDTTVYQEDTIHKNVLSCNYCSYTVGKTKNAAAIMQEHCDCLPSHKNTFQCFRASCKVSYPCLDLLRCHNLVHGKSLVLIRPLQCNFCQFSCCFELNMHKHWKKMHSNKQMVECEHCQAKFYCDDLKLQHIVFQCRDGIDSEFAKALQSPFKYIMKSDDDDLEEGELVVAPEIETVVMDELQDQQKWERPAVNIGNAK